MPKLFDAELVFTQIPLLLAYLPVTLELTVAAMIIGWVLGLIIALVKQNKIPVLYQIAAVFVSVMRGTPIIVQLYLSYFGIPLALKYFNYYHGSSYTINVIPSIVFAIVALGLNQSAFDSETIRSAINSVDKGQIEAAKSINMTNTQILRRILEMNRIPHRSLELLFPVAEEVYCRGSRVLDFGALRSKEAYVLDLSGPVGSAAVCAPTLISFTVEVKGKTAHAGFEPEKGVHAIQAAACAVQKLKLGRIGTGSTRNVGIIRGGFATNIIPDLVVLEGEIRSYLHNDALSLMEDTRTVFETNAADYGASAAVTSDIRIQAYETSPESSAARNFSAACRALALEPRFESTFGGSDNNNFALHGITGIVVACGMQRPHTTGEYTTLADLSLVTELVLQLMTTPVFF